MRARSDLVRVVGNVLLTPVNLSEVAELAACKTALLVGSGETERAVSALRKLAPRVSVDVMNHYGLRSVRTRRYDLCCLLLTGEGRRRDKILGLLAGARVLLAFGAAGEWYRVNVPPMQPASLKWWARVTLSGLLGLVYIVTALKILGLDALRRLVPAVPAPPDPGAPKGVGVTFIIPTYNQRHLMDFCIPPLLVEADQEHRVLVVDDASSDGTAEYVHSRYPTVRVLRLNKNEGFVGAVRAGIASCRTPLFALINTDVQVRPGFLRTILPHFERANVFAVCSRIVLPDGSGMETGNVANDFSGILEPYHVAPSEQGPILYAGGASSVYHRARYQSLGGFETIYRPLYWEDIDLGYRAWRRGWRSEFEPAASVWHQRRAWIGKRFGDEYANETFLKNALLFTWKNVRDWGLLAQHVCYVYARLMTEITAGDGTMCRALLRTLPVIPWVMIIRFREYRRGDLRDRQIMRLAQPINAREKPHPPSPSPRAERGRQLTTI